MAHARPLATLALLTLLCAPLTASPAEPRTELVVLKDGSMFQGELVEKVVGDHVTIKLSTGEIRNFPWAALQPPPPDVPEAPPPPPPPSPPPPSPYVVRPPANSFQRYVLWPQPDRTLPRLVGQFINIGVGVGWDFPSWFPFNVLVSYEPAGWLDLELSGRYGNPFGPSIGEMAHFGLPIYDAARFGLGLGLQQSFLTHGDIVALSANGYRAPPTSHFFNVELFADSFFGPNFVVRTLAGVGILLNHASYRSVCNSDACFDQPYFVGAPSAAAYGETVYGYAKFELMWRFRL